MSSAADIRAAARTLRAARRVAVFTGAGVSAESGIATFRDEGGIWERYPPEQFATWGGLLATAALQPRRLARFLHEVFEPLAAARPNLGHEAIAALEQHVETTVITQNIDGLHQEAGSSTVWQIHGSMLEVVDLGGQLVRTLTRPDLLELSRALDEAASRRFALSKTLRAVQPVIGLSRRGFHRPNVVLFGQSLNEPDWGYAQRVAERCDAMVVVGTSGVVMPAAELPLLARGRGARIILVDPDAGLPAHVHLRGTAGELLPELVAHAFGGSAPAD